MHMQQTQDEARLTPLLILCCDDTFIFNPHLMTISVLESRNDALILKYRTLPRNWATMTPPR
jgi:hypothetical protein